MQQPSNIPYRMQNNAQIDILYLVRAVLRNSLIVLLSGWIGFLWGFMSVDFLEHPDYISSAYMIIRNKDNPDQILPDSTIKKVAEQYQKTFTSNVMQRIIRNELHKEKMPVNITARVADGTNILLVNGIAGNPMDAFAIVNTAVKNYPKVTDYLITDYVLEEIRKPTVPYNANNRIGHKRCAVLGALIGMLLSAGVIVLINLLRNDVKNENQVEEFLDTTLFGTWYFEKRSRKNKKKGILMNSSSTSFLYTENVRKTATRLDYRAKKENRKVILITSVLENEGKTTVAANLAIALASQNHNVLLIDADLRKPSMYRMFKKNLTQRQEIGAFLSGEADLQQVLTRDKDTGIYYLFGSASCADSDRLLSSEEMRALLKNARKYMDYVIIDCAPMNHMMDAELLCPMVDGVLMVVRQGYANVPAINDALDVLQNSEGKVMGCLYNAVQTQLIPDTKEYGFGYSYYSYGYGKAYGFSGRYGRYGKEDQKPKKASAEKTVRKNKKKATKDSV